MQYSQYPSQTEIEMADDSTPPDATQQDTTLFQQMMTQQNQQFQLTMQQNQQLFSQTMVSIINQNTSSKNQDTTINQTQAGNIVIEQPINLP
jgi:hypothetical protein